MMGVCKLFLKLIVLIVFQIACAQHQHAHPHPTLQAKLVPSLNTRILPNLKGSVNLQRHPSALHTNVQSRLYNSHSQLDDDDEKRSNLHLTSSGIYHHQDSINNRGLPFLSNIKDGVKELSDVYQQPVKVGNVVILSKVNVDKTGKTSTTDESSAYRQGLLLQKPSKFQNQEPISSRSHLSDVYQQPVKLKNLVVMSKVNTKSQNSADDGSDDQDDDNYNVYRDPENRLYLPKLPKSQNREQSFESISSRSHLSDVYQQPVKLKNLVVMSKVNTKSQNTADGDSDYQDDDNDGRYIDPANRLLLQKLPKSQNPEQSSGAISSRSHVSDVYEQPTKLKNLIVMSKVNTNSQNTADDDSDYQDDDNDGRYVDPANRLLLQKLPKSQNREQSSESISSRSHLSDVYQQPVKLKNLVVMSKVNTNSQHTAGDDSDYQDDDNDGRYVDPANRLLLQKLPKSQNREQSSESISSRSHLSDVYQQPVKLKNLVVMSKVNTNSQHTAGDDSDYQDDDNDGRYVDPANRLLLQKLPKSQNREQSSGAISSRSHVSDVYEQPTKLKNLIVMSKVNTNSQNTADDDSDYQDDDNDGRYVDPANRLLLQKLPKSQNREQSSGAISSRSHVSDVYEQPTKLKNLIVMSKVNTNSQNTADDDSDYQDDDNDGRYVDPANRLLLQKLPKSQNREQSSESISSRSHLSDVYQQPVKLKNLVVMSKVNTNSQHTAGDDSDYQDDDNDGRYVDPANRLLLQKLPKSQNREQSSESISSRSHLSDVYQQPVKLKNLVVMSKVNTNSQHTAGDDSDYQDDDNDGRYVDPANRLLLQKLPKSQNREQSSESISSRSHLSDVYQQPVKLKNLVVMSKVNTNSQNTADDDSDYHDDDNDGRYVDPANRLLLQKLPKSQNREQSSESISSRSHLSDVYQQPVKLKNLVVMSKVNTNSQHTAGDDSDYQDDDNDGRYVDPANRLLLQKLPKSQNREQSSESISSRSHLSDVYQQPVKLKNLVVMSKVNTNSQNTADDDSDYHDDDNDGRYVDPANRLLLQKLPKSQNREQSSESISSRSHLSDVYQQPVKLKNLVVMSKVNTNSQHTAGDDSDYQDDDNDGRYVDPANRLLLQNLPKSQNREQSSESISSRSHLSDVYQQPVKLKNLVVMSKVNTNSQNTANDDSDYQDDDNDGRYVDPANRLLLQKLPNPQNQRQSSESISSRSHISDVYEQPTKLKNLVLLSKVNTNSQKEVNDADNSDDDQSNDDGPEDDVDSRNVPSVEYRKFPFDSGNAADVYEQPVKLDNMFIMSKVNTDSLNSVGGSTEQKKSKKRKHHRRPVTEQQEQPEQSAQPGQPEQPEQPEESEESEESEDRQPYPDNDDGYGRKVPYDNSVANRYYGSNNDDNNYQQPAKSTNVEDVYQQPVDAGNVVIMSKVNTESGSASRNHEKHRSRKRYQQPYPNNDDGYDRRSPYEDDNSVAKRYYGSNDDNNNYQQPAKSTNVEDVYQQPVDAGNVVIMSKVNTESGSASRNHEKHRNRKGYQQPYPNNDDGYDRRSPYEDDNSVAKRYYGSNDDNNNYQQPAKSTNVEDVYEQPVDAGNVVIMSKVNTESGPASRNHEKHRSRKRYQQPYPNNDEGYDRRSPYQDDNSVAKRYYGSNDDDNNYQRPAKSNDLVVLSEVNGKHYGYGRRSPYENDDSIVKRYYEPNDDNGYQRPEKADGVTLISQINEGSNPGSGDRERYRNRKRYQRPYSNNDDGYGRRNPYEDGNSIAKRYYEPNDDNDYQRHAKADGVALISQVNEGSSSGSGDRERYRNRKHYQRPYSNNDDGYGRRNPYEDDNSIAKRYYEPNDDNDYQRPAKADGVALISQVNEGSSSGSGDRERYRNRKRYQRPYSNNDDGYGRRNPYEDDNSIAKRYYEPNDDNDYQRPAKTDGVALISQVNEGSSSGSGDRERYRNRKRYQRPYSNNDDGYGRRNPYEDDNSIAKRYYEPNDDNDYQRPAKADGVALISQVNEGSSSGSGDRERYRNRKRYQRPYSNNDDGYGRRNPYEDDNSIAKRYYEPNDDNDYQRPAKTDGVALISQVNEGSSPVALISEGSISGSGDRERYRNRKRYQRPYSNNDDGYGRRNPYEDDNSIAKRYYEPNDDNDYQRPAKADGVALISQVNEGSSPVALISEGASRGSEDREGHRQRKHYGPYPYDYEDSRRRNAYDDGMVN